MVKINRSSRSVYGIQRNNRYFSAHLIHLSILSVLGLIVTLYIFLANVEERQIMMVSALPVSRIIATHKPFLMYGTAWKKEETAKYVQQAIRTGFRFIDTACQPKHYNEAGVGAGWTAAASELGLERSDLFLQTKYTPYPGQDPNNVPYDKDASLTEQVRQSLAVSLQNLRTDYIDSLVLHSPLPTVEQTMEVWSEFENFVDAGKVRQLGVSNCYDYAMFVSIYERARIKPAVLQNRFYADSNFDTELRQFCKEKNIWYQSFWTLTANREALASKEVRDWADSLNLTPQTLMYAFLMSLGYPKPLDGTTNLKHMAEDVAIMERLQKGESIFKNEAELRKFAQLLGMPDL
ncbi:hypothetical protein FisN_3Hh318 [Fistulifera solaris]|uniref:NADP-dependent oxidoreductase domain-containing protein n=1 Tax=Fistulifera solaris TaxID=1519565 RepID=A0A1Z5JR00_FISSO|nr:hypothetical protein FisN_3Hh318 [Fistulifera solaris]|eukprot:GAX16201.1 hypothetical protein FisN_3Hh318 [Fistulifera solaris]